MMNTRPHPMYAKFAMAKMAIQDPDRFFKVFAGPDGEQLLHNFWSAIGKDLPPNEQMSPEGLSSKLMESNNLMLTFPPALNSNEPHFIVVVMDGDNCRVFCLEVMEPMAPSDPATVICEFSKKGRANWGIECAADPLEFEETVNRLVADKEAQPLTFRASSL